ncbi:MAG: hypothetical protein IAI50_20790, partial [Candidatus Eremiobacteraeota bacterium]|nr:hypothetical protein [Candidatus Eremiobacteraeota bacterium]
LVRHGIASGYLPVGEGEVRSHAKELCAANAGTRVLLTSTLAVKHPSDAKPSVELDVTAYDCAGVALGRQEHFAASGSGRDALAEALHRAALAAADGVAKAASTAKPAGSG